MEDWRTFGLDIGRTAKASLIWNSTKPASNLTRNLPDLTLSHPLSPSLTPSPSQTAVKSVARGGAHVRAGPGRTTKFGIQQNQQLLL